jgi:hypothetical protein
MTFLFPWYFLLFNFEDLMSLTKKGKIKIDRERRPQRENLKPLGALQSASSWSFFP